MRPNGLAPGLPARAPSNGYSLSTTRISRKVVSTPCTGSRRLVERRRQCARASQRHLRFHTLPSTGSMAPIKRCTHHRRPLRTATTFAPSRYTHIDTSHCGNHLFIPHVYNHDTRAFFFSHCLSSDFSLVMIPFLILQACWRPQRVRRFGGGLFCTQCFGLGGFLFRRIKIDHIPYLLNLR